MFLRINNIVSLVLALLYFLFAILGLTTQGNSGSDQTGSMLFFFGSMILFFLLSVFCTRLRKLNTTHTAITASMRTWGILIAVASGIASLVFLYEVYNVYSALSDSFLFTEEKLTVIKAVLIGTAVVCVTVLLNILHWGILLKENKEQYDDEVAHIGEDLGQSPKEPWQS